MVEFYLRRTLGQRPHERDEDLSPSPMTKDRFTLSTGATCLNHHHGKLTRLTFRRYSKIITCIIERSSGQLVSTCRQCRKNMVDLRSTSYLGNLLTHTHTQWIPCRPARSVPANIRASTPGLSGIPFK